MLCADDLLACHGEEGAGFDCGVVGDDHAGSAGDASGACDDAGAWCAAVLCVHVVRGPEAEFCEGVWVVDEFCDAFACGEAVFGVLAFDGGFTAAEFDDGFGFEDLLGECAEGLVVVCGGRGGGVARGGLGSGRGHVLWFPWLWCGCGLDLVVGSADQIAGMIWVVVGGIRGWGFLACGG